MPVSKAMKRKIISVIARAEGPHPSVGSTSVGTLVGTHCER